VEQGGTELTKPRKPSTQRPTAKTLRRSVHPVTEGAEDTWMSACAGCSRGSSVIHRSDSYRAGASRILVRNSINRHPSRTVSLPWRLIERVLLPSEKMSDLPRGDPARLRSDRSLHQEASPPRDQQPTRDTGHTWACPSLRAVLQWQTLEFAFLPVSTSLHPDNGERRHSQPELLPPISLPVGPVAH
jgi:hypothetical protein